MGTTRILPPSEEGTIAAIADAAAQLPGADDWQVQVLHNDEMQLYLIGHQVESRRTVTNERAIVTLYNDHTPADPLQLQERRALLQVPITLPGAASPP